MRFSCSMILPVLACVLLVQPVSQAAEQDLMQVFAVAVNHSPKLKSLAFSREAIQHEIEGLQAQRWVNLDASLTGSETLSTTAANSNMQTGLQLTNTFDIANKKGFDIQLKEFERLKNYYQANLERKTLFISLSTDYYRLLAARQLLALHQATGEQLLTQINLLTVGVEKGKFAAMDKDRLQIEWLNQQTLLSSDQLEINQRLQNLRQLMGIELKEIPSDALAKSPVSPPDLTIGPGQPESKDAARLQAKYLQNAPELQLIVMDRQSEEVNLHKEEAGWYPDLTVSEQYQLSTFTPSPEALRQTTANLSFKFLDGARGPLVEAHTARIKGFESDYVTQERILQNQFQNAWSELGSLYATHLILTKAQAQARNNRERLLVGYQRQFIDLTTLITAQRDWLALEATYLDNLARYHQASSALLHQIQGDIFK